MNWEIIIYASIAGAFLVYLAINDKRKTEFKNRMDEFERIANSNDYELIIQTLKSNELQKKYHLQIFNAYQHVRTLDECIDFYSRIMTNSIYGSDRQKFVSNWAITFIEKKQYLEAIRILQLIPTEDVIDYAKSDFFEIPQQMARSFYLAGKPDLALSSISLVWSGRKPLNNNALPLMYIKYQSELALGENRKAKNTIQKILTFRYDNELDDILKSI